MSQRYYLHRISHEDNVSYSLIKKKRILTLGWELFSDSDILEKAREEGYPNFDVVTKKYDQNHNRSRWSMWYFAKMEKGDIVVVPLYDGKFSVYEVDEPAKPITYLENEIASVVGMWNKHNIVWKEHRLFDEMDSRRIDLGFYIKVTPIVEDVPRRFVAGKFASRMKIRTTNADITDIKKHVDDGIKAGQTNKPITLYEEAIDSLVTNLQKSICEVLNPDRFEELIKWYLDKIGASSSWIPPKNEAGKRDGADADIIAEFNNLKYMVYVQAKWHIGETSDWAVYQIDSYKNQMSDEEYDYTYATWVVSSADKFGETAITEAKGKGVRLIDGKEFARMLVDIGMLDINEAFENE